MDLIKVIEEQSVFAFTGKINILLKENNQYLGAIWQKDGFICSAYYKNISNKKALFQIVFEDLENPEKFRFLVEPELISTDHQIFEISFEGFYKELQSIYSNYQKTKSLRPPGHLRLAVNGAFILQGDDITQKEFDVLTLIASNGSVLDLYAESDLYDFELTNILVSLRKKKAIKVVCHQK